MSRSRRKVNVRKPAPNLILIVTEGEKTEPLYFECFRLYTTHVARIVGLGIDPMSLVYKTAVELEKAKKEYQREYNIRLRNTDIVVWCVFDKDSILSDDFDNAIASAEAQGYRVAYSNEAFELWYLLHYEYYNTPISRDSYKQRLSTHLSKTYEKNDKDMYQILKHRQVDAIRNAKRLLSLYKQQTPSRNNPSTTVFKLVEYLNQFIRSN